MLPAVLVEAGSEGGEEGRSWRGCWRCQVVVQNCDGGRGTITRAYGYEYGKVGWVVGRFIMMRMKEHRSLRLE